MNGLLFIYWGVCGIVFPGGYREGLLIMLKAYFDDSGTHDDSEIVSVGGLIGTEDQWEEFDRGWAALLAEPLPGKPSLKKFHLSPCNARDGEFAGYTNAECDAVTHDFRQVMIDARLLSTASSVDKRAWDELVVGKNREWTGDAVDVCVENCLTETIKIAGAHPEGAKVAVVFDRGIWTPRLKEVTEGYTLNLASPRIVSLTFSDVASERPLQAADICATENYWHAIGVLRNGIGAQPRPHMRHYLENMFAEGFMITRDQIVQMLPELERQRVSTESPS